MDDKPIEVNFNLDNQSTFKVVPQDYKLKLKIVNKSNTKNPAYESIGASGFDLRANLEKPVTLKSLERYAIPTGLYFDIPTGYEIQVRPRSGLAAKNGITVLNSPGTVK